MISYYLKRKKGGQKMNLCKILVAPGFDNSAFYKELLIKKGLQPDSIDVNILAPDQLSVGIEWYPLILLQRPQFFELTQFLPEKFKLQEQDWFVVDPIMTVQNRVFAQPLTREKELHIFTQSTCYPCHTLMAKLDKMKIPYTRLNQRSELWYRLNIKKTPAMIWAQTYFFDSPRGFLLTPYAELVPSGTFQT